MDQSQRYKYVSRFEPLALHPRLHHREGFLIHYLPPKEPPTRRVSSTLGVPISSLKQPPHNRGVNQQPTPLPKRFTTTLQTPPHQEGVNTNFTSTKEGTNQSLDQPLPKRDTTRTRVFTTSGSKNHKLSFLSSFPQYKILID